VNTPFTDTLTVTIDGNQVTQFVEPATAEAGYSLRSFPVNFASAGNHTILFSYDGPTTFVANFSVDNISLIAGGAGCPTPSVSPSVNPTPSPSPSCSPGGGAGPWTAAAPYPSTNVRYGFAQTATHLYVLGGVSDGSRINTVNRLDLATGVWQARNAMPFTSEAPSCALMPSTTLIYCAEGDTGNGFASYDIVSGAWVPLAVTPTSNNYGAAMGAFNGKVFLAGGGSGGASSTLSVYDVATNTWSAGTAAPDIFLLPGYQQVGQFLYVVGGFGSVPGAEATSVLHNGERSEAPDANNGTTLRLDMSSAPGVWSSGPAFTPGRADFGLAYDPGTNKLYALGGDANGGGFFDSTNLVDELSLAAWPAGSWTASAPNLPAPNRQANQAGFFGSGQIWSVGGLDGSTFLFSSEVLRRTNGGGGACPSPSVAPTPSPSPSCVPDHYAIAQIGGATIVPGTTRVDPAAGCDDCVSTVAIPFSYTLYDQSFTSLEVDSNGKAHFPTGASVFTNTCLPQAGATYSIYPYWEDQRTDLGTCSPAPCGIYTSVSGSAPNRILNIEWRGTYFSGGGTANHELRLYEGQSRFDVIYGTVTQGNASATAGVQKNAAAFDQYFCNGSGGASSGGQSYTLQGCGTPSPSPTSSVPPSPSPSPSGSPGQLTMQFASATYTEDESQTATITVTRSVARPGEGPGVVSTVDYATSNGSATGGAACGGLVDFIHTSGTLTFQIGETEKTFSVVTCPDSLVEANETVNLTLSNPTNGSIGNPGTAVLTINDTANEFRNGTCIDMNLGAPAVPYPSEITVVNGPTQIGGLRITLFDLTHQFPDNIDVLLEGPQGQKFILMGDAGGPVAVPTPGVTLTFTDTAGQVLPNNGPLTTGNFEPTNWESPVGSFPPPAPPAPYNEPGSTVGGTGLQTLNGNFFLSNANGTWRLWVRDDAGTLLDPNVVVGSICGWGIQFLQSTAAGVSLSGRVTTAEGAGIRNARLTITGNSLPEPLEVTTGSFGYYSFEGLTAGETYVVTVNSQRYTFQVPSRVYTLVDNIVDADFVANP
jgi:hypothetical protein